MTELRIYLTEAGELARLNGFSNASEFLKALSEKVGRVIVMHRGMAARVVFENGQYAGRYSEGG